MDIDILNYSLILDAAPPTTSAQIQISVQPDPSNFSLATTLTTDSGTIIGILVCLNSVKLLASVN